MEENGDLLSSLSSEILQHIISMLSLKEAVQISTLSTSWWRLMCPSRLNLSSNQELHHTIQSLSESGAGFRTLILHLDATALAVCTKGVNGELHLDFSPHILIPTTFSLVVKQATRRPTFSLIKTLHLRSIPRLPGDTLSDLCCCGVIFSQLDFQFSRLKDLKMTCSKVSSKTRDSFACFLHITLSLEELELRVRIEQGWSGGVEYPSHCQNWHDAHLWKDYTTVKEEACRLKHMKKVRIMGFTKVRIMGFTMEREELLWIIVPPLLKLSRCRRWSSVSVR